MQKVMLWIYEKDRKTAKPISGLPVLVVETKAGERRLSDPLPRDMVEGMASRYVYRDESLKADLIRGRLELELDGKTFAAKVLMEHKHERDH
ncbi:MAG: hypothetical protein CSA62_05670 [Planctomycetota bacterium]|nr:MAG: hypothetical protein CSA62_05670 [Planctomycetota bacterium]